MKLKTIPDISFPAAFSRPQKNGNHVIMNFLTAHRIMFRKAVVRAPDQSSPHFAAAAVVVPVVARGLLDAADLNPSVDKTVPSGPPIPP